MNAAKSLEKLIGSFNLGSLFTLCRHSTLALEVEARAMKATR
jgi:hypothetical protein